jgi:hypothetical protein
MPNPARKMLFALACLSVLPGMALSPPGDAMHFSIESSGSAYHAGQAVILHWRLSNHGARALWILGAMESPGRRDFDPISLSIQRLTPGAGAAVAVLTLMGKRSAARRVLYRLAPGDSHVESFDLSMFAEYYAIRLSPGDYRLNAQYDLGGSGILADDERAGAWTRRVAAAPLLLHIIP